MDVCARGGAPSSSHLAKEDISHGRGAVDELCREAHQESGAASRRKPASRTSPRSKVVGALHSSAWRRGLTRDERSAHWEGEHQCPCRPNKCVLTFACLGPTAPCWAGLILVRSEMVDFFERTDYG